MWPILVPYGSHMDVPRWVPDESLLQNPHQSHMGCPYRTHIITHLGPIWVLYYLLAGLLPSRNRFNGLAVHEFDPLIHLLAHLITHAIAHSLNQSKTQSPRDVE